MVKLAISFLSALLLISGCSEGSAETQSSGAPSNGTKTAIFAGGCFWCVESDFEKVDGVSAAISGYTGGKSAPTYKQVASGRTKHVEAVEVYYDPSVISYAELLDHFWRQIDPTDDGGQFVDRGYQYSPFVYVRNETERKITEDAIAALKKSKRYKKTINVGIKETTTFYPAEDYHQDYYKKNPLRYKYYRYNSGRDQYLSDIWGDDLKIKKIKKAETKKANGEYMKPSDQEIKEKLTKLQYNVTQKDATERAFSNAYWDNKQDGIYVDIVSGEPLFTSLDKYDSKTGWPSFTQPIESRYVVEKTDYKLIYPRTEVRSYHGDSHLGHVFNDGPQPTGQRYCINSAALRFIKTEDLYKEGYGKYAYLFDQ